MAIGVSVVLIRIAVLIVWAGVVIAKKPTGNYTVIEVVILGAIIIVVVAIATTIARSININIGEEC